MKCAMFSPTDSEGRSNNSVLLTIHLIMVRFFMKIIAPRPHLLLLDVYFGEVYGNEKMVVLIFSWCLMKKDKTPKK